MEPVRQDPRRAVRRLVKPLRFPASFVNWLILNIAAFTPFIREGKKAQKKWEEGFYGNGGPPATAAPVVAPTQSSSHTA